jgi:hypothetical protein
MLELKRLLVEVGMEAGIRGVEDGGSKGRLGGNFGNGSGGHKSSSGTGDTSNLQQRSPGGQLFFRSFVN